MPATYEDQIRRLRQHETFKREQEKLEFYADLRDDVISLIRNSGVSYETIHEKCGPHPSTLRAWEDKRVSRPQLGKMRSVLRILGLDFTIVSRANITRIR